MWGWGSGAGAWGDGEQGPSRVGDGPGQSESEWRAISGRSAPLRACAALGDGPAAGPTDPAIRPPPPAGARQVGRGLIAQRELDAFLGPAAAVVSESDGDGGGDGGDGGGGGADSDGDFW